MGSVQPALSAPVPREKLAGPPLSPYRSHADPPLRRLVPIQEAATYPATTRPVPLFPFQSTRRPLQLASPASSLHGSRSGPELKFQIPPSSTPNMVADKVRESRRCRRQTCRFHLALTLTLTPTLLRPVRISHSPDATGERRLRSGLRNKVKPGRGEHTTTHHIKGPSPQPSPGGRGGYVLSAERGPCTYPSYPSRLAVPSPLGRGSG